MSRRHTSWIKLLRILLPLIVIGIIILAALVDWRDDETILSEFEAPDFEFQNQEAIINDFNIKSQNEDGQLIGIIADEAEIIKTEKEEKIEATNLSTQLDLNDIHWSVTANAGEVRNNGTNIIYKGNVLAELDDSFSLVTEKLEFDTNKNNVKSDTTSIFSGPELYIESDQFIYERNDETPSQNEENITFNNNVYAKIIEGTKVESQELILNYQNDRENTQLYSRHHTTASADNIEITGNSFQYIDDETGSILIFKDAVKGTIK